MTTSYSTNSLDGFRQTDLGKSSLDTVESADQNKLVFEYQKLEGQKINIKDVYPQILASCISLSFVIQAGISMCFSAILLPQLMDPESTFKVNQEQASWIASLMAIGTPVGSFICGPLMDFFGRKKFSLMCCFPNIIAWLLIVFTPNSVWLLYIGRMIAGLSGGMSTVTSVYVAEITNQQYRPMLLSLNSVFVSFGILLTTVLGSYLHWRTVSVCCACCTVGTFLLTVFVNPESPVWLVNFNQNKYNSMEQAKSALSWLNPNKKIFTLEWQKLITSRLNADKLLQNQDSSRFPNTQPSFCSKLYNSISGFSTPSALKPLLILLVIFLLQQLSGAYPIIFYAVQLFQSVESNMNEYTALVVLGALRFIMSVISLGLSGIYGRRTLMMFSSIGMTLSSLATALVYSQSYLESYIHGNTTASHLLIKNSTYLTLETNSSLLNSTPSSLMDMSLPLYIPPWIGILCIIVFVGISSIGVLTIPWTLTGELLPTSVRGTGSGLLVSFAYILLFLVVKSFPSMLISFKVSGLFYAYSLVSFITLLFVYFFLPETLGKSLEEIERYFLKT